MPVHSQRLSEAFERDLAEHCKPLPHEETLDLIRRAQAGDAEARARVIMTNTRLVVMIARKEFRRRHIDIEELVQEGVIGLCKAVEKFDPTRGVKFGSYAAFWIRERMLDFATSYGPAMQLKHSTRMQRKVLYHRHTVKAETSDEIAAQLDVDPTETRYIMEALRSAISFDIAVTDDKQPLSERLVAMEPTQEEAIIDREGALYLRQVIASLDLDERGDDLVYRRLLAEEPATLTDLGDSWGVTRERARQLEARLLTQIRRRYLAPIKRSAAS